MDATKLKMVGIEEIRPYKNNPRLNDEAVGAVANSIKEFGFKVPIIIDRNNVIVAGHTRLKAAKRLRLKEVPVVVADDLTDDQIRAFRLADNKVGEIAEWDLGKLDQELENVLMDMEQFGFLGNEECDLDNEYTNKTGTIQYEPTGEEVELADLTVEDKTNELLERIENSNVSDEEKEFLRKAANRHRAFDYHKIAEYYAQASPEMQELMEDSALVIIDLEDAIAKGYAKFKGEVDALWGGGWIRRMKNEFCVFILSHGRPHNIKTLQTLKKGGYTGNWYVVIDDEDETENEYRKLYGDHILQFSKKEIAQTFDSGDLSEDRRTIVYARNACFELAKQLGIKYFLELDDDYSTFDMRRIDGKRLSAKTVRDLDSLFAAMVGLLETSGALTVAFAQAGDFIGGASSNTFKKGPLLRKAMNTLFCKTERRFQFVGRINEDVNTYVTLSNIGKLLFSVIDVAIVQSQTQANAGGMTDVYLDNGTYLKSFYSVMYAPQAVRVGVMHSRHERIHHHVKWNYCAPKILSEKWRKKR